MTLRQLSLPRRAWQEDFRFACVVVLLVATNGCGVFSFDRFWCETGGGCWYWEVDRCRECQKSQVARVGDGLILGAACRISVRGKSNLRRSQVRTVLTNCTIIDCTGQPPLKEMSLIIEGDRISELKAGKYGPPAGEGERVLDLDGGYVLPGLWNVHVHLGDLIPDPQFLLETESPIDYAIRAGRNLPDKKRAPQ